MGLHVGIAAVGLMLLGGKVIEFGARGFREGGLPVTAGRQLRGRPAKVVGVLLMWLGMLIFGATAAGLLSLG
jgi:hypothetical protein